MRTRTTFAATVCWLIVNSDTSLADSDDVERKLFAKYDEILEEFAIEVDNPSPESLWEFLAPRSSVFPAPAAPTPAEMAAVFKRLEEMP